jgi:hypothetical protein
MSTSRIVYQLDELKGGASGGNRGDNFAIFRSPAEGTFPRTGRGELKLYTSDWIKRGRPTEIAIMLPDEPEES